MTGARTSDREEVRDPLLSAEEGGSAPSAGNTSRAKSKGLVRRKRSNDSVSVLNGQNSIPFIKKKRMVILIVLVLALIYLNTVGLTWDGHTADKIPVYHHSHVPGMKENNASTTVSVLYENISSTLSIPLIPPPGYLVWSDKCKMLNLDPYDPEVMKHFKREKYEPCSSYEPLTSTKYNPKTKRYLLNIEESLREQYAKYRGKLSCCYQVIERTGSGKYADDKYNLTDCMDLPKSTELPTTTENVLVKCKMQKKQTYINAHAMTPERPQVRQRLNNWKETDTKRPVSILMLGIDSISRQNLIRAMPKTAQHLYDTEWFEMSGYNKVDDNTFPNLMAILTGYNGTSAYRTCDATVVGKLDKCPFIWKEFKNHGYVTAYAEDEVFINTFNYMKKGFLEPPVDYYFRPFLLAAEANLPVKRKSTLHFCLGFKHSADFIYDYALELATVYKNDPYFGLFWTNTFSHNAISDCSSMDEKIVEYLHKLSDRGILNRSVVIFFSDHGIRFGPTRSLLSGHLEERLPFFFVWLPPWLKNDHPEFVNALNVNKNRLTNPFDVHMTLKHILELSGRASNLSQAQDCLKCQTLLRPVPHSRSCDDISIEDHWCTCLPYKSIPTDIEMVRKVVNFSIEHINSYLASYNNGSVADLCAKIHLHQIKHAYKVQLPDNASNSTTGAVESFRLVFETNPGMGLFEGTVRYYTAIHTLEMTGSISRLNSYAKDSHCLADSGAKKYCYCVKNGHASARVPTAG